MRIVGTPYAPSPCYQLLQRAYSNHREFVQVKPGATEDNPGLQGSGSDIYDVPSGIHSGGRPKQTGYALNCSNGYDARIPSRHWRDGLCHLKSRHCK